MNYTIKEIDGKLYRVFANGGRLPYKEESPLTKDLPALPGVYMVTQVSTGLSYIGSSKDVKERCSGYLRPAAQKKSGKRMNEVLKTVVAFTLLEVSDCVDEEHLNKRELHFINKFNTIHPNGFNMKCPVTKKNLSSERILPDFSKSPKYSGFMVRTVRS